MAEGRFVLVFHEDLIANYGAVWDDDRALATWLRLIALADKQWPSPAEMPRAAKASIVRALVAAGLIEELPNHRYKVRGLDAQRQRKADAARNAAGIRWGNAPSNPKGNANQSGSGNESESSGVEGSGERGADALDAWYRLTGSWPSSKVLPWLNRLIESHGDAAVCTALGAEWQVDPARNTILGRVNSRLEKAAHDAEKRRVEANKKAAEEERKRIESMPAEQRAANLERLRRAMEEKGLIVSKPENAA